MVHREVPRHDPVNLHGLVHLVDASTDQLERHGLHHEHLNLVALHHAPLGELRKSQTPLILSAIEEQFKEGKNPDFLVQVGHLFHDGGEAGDKVLVTLNSSGKLADLSATQCHQQIVKPLEVAPNKTA